MNSQNLTSDNIICIPALNDNYIWLLLAGDLTYVIDPGEASAVIAWCTQQQRQLSGILVTHTHWDHVQGIGDLTAHFGQLPIYAYEQAVLADEFVPLRIGERLSLAAGLELDIYLFAGHTPDHIGFYWAAEKALFCGDSLFTGGCGRLFDGGTAEQMTTSLAQIAQFPIDTRIYCAHEYTLANLRFALRVESNNPETQARLALAKQQRQQGQACVPSQLSTELATNPFLRTHIPSVATAIQLWWQTQNDSDDPVEIFARLREWKNQLDKTGILEQDE